MKNLNLKSCSNWVEQFKKIHTHTHAHANIHTRESEKKRWKQASCYKMVPTLSVRVRSNRRSYCVGLKELAQASRKRSASAIHTSVLGDTSVPLDALPFLCAQKTDFTNDDKIPCLRV